MIVAKEYLSQRELDSPMFQARRGCIGPLLPPNRMGGGDPPLPCPER